MHLGWVEPERVSKKADLRVIVERLAVAEGFLEPEQSEAQEVKLPGVVEKLSFEQYMQLERVKADMERERWQFQLEQERLKVVQTEKTKEAEMRMALELESLKLEQLKLELVREGKAGGSFLGLGSAGRAVGGTGFDVAGNYAYCQSLMRGMLIHFFLCLNEWRTLGAGLMVIER